MPAGTTLLARDLVRERRKRIGPKKTSFEQNHLCAIWRWHSWAFQMERAGSVLVEETLPFPSTAAH